LEWVLLSSPFKEKKMQSQITKYQLERRLLELVDHYRSLIIDPIEQEIGSTLGWPYVRSRLLKALGDRGLAGQIQEILNHEFSKIDQGAK
jgi:hypothetical protein